MKFTLSLFLLFLFFYKSDAQQVNMFSLLQADSSLIKNASVIKDDENIELDITDVDRLTYTVHQLYTVLDEKGKDALDFMQYTNKYTSLEDADIEVYDKDGKQIQKFRKKDMTTVSYGDGLIEDGYVTYFRVSAPDYPVTVAYNYKLKYTGTVQYPSFDIMSSGEAVLKSTFTARVLKGLDLRYKDKNIKIKPVISEDDKYKQYQWTVSGLKAIEYEAGGPKGDSDPSVQLAPNKFSYYHKEGDFTSWNNFGKWISQLYKGLDELPPERKQFFTDLVKNATNDKEKAEIIYDYLQKNFRYVSIQLGIGGVRPFPASYTDAKKYGDCKALSNYMKAALNAVGIKSYVALVNAEYNREPVDPSFPEDGFNHVILCIPQPHDSIWLECTSKTTDFGVLGSFTENRNALLITDDGGVLVHTPVSMPKENTLTVKTLAEITEDGSGTSVTTFAGSGSFKEDFLSNFMGENKDDQKKFLIDDIGFKQPNELQVGKIENSKKLTATVKMGFEKIPDFIAGDKMFVSPRLFHLWSYNLPKSEKRRLPFYFPDPFIVTDTTVFKIPAGFTVDALPTNQSFSCDYGNYLSGFRFDTSTNSIYSVARLELTEHEIPPKQYASVKNFFDEVMRHENQKFVIKKE